jgi:DNA-binding CsgD family transcriptional regulator
MLSVLLFVFYLLWDKRRERSFMLLFACVAIANCGYFLEAVAGSLTGALIANGVAYFGAAYSVLVMLFIISDVCRSKKRKWVRYMLIGISTCAFLLAASGSWLGLYYKSVSIVTVNGMTHLIKEYGPLHILYAVYLLVYVISMIVQIIWAAVKKRLSSGKYALFLLVAVCFNLGVWAVEQALNEEFEFLSVSYIVTEVLLLLIYELLWDYGIIREETGMVSAQMMVKLQQPVRGELPPDMQKLFDSFSRKVRSLSSAERRILNYYINGIEIAEVPDLAYISIHTVKKHNRSIYQKLEVASRDELMLYIELFRCCNRLDELTGQTVETE